MDRDAPQSDCRWTAKSDADWIRFGGNSTIYDRGRSGSGSLFYNVLANTHPDARAAHATISLTSGGELVHSVSQEHPVSCSMSSPQTMAVLVPPVESAHPGPYAKEGSIVIAGLSGANPAATHKIHIAAQ